MLKSASLVFGVFTWLARTECTNCSPVQNTVPIVFLKTLRLFAVNTIQFTPKWIMQCSLDGRIWNFVVNKRASWYATITKCNITDPQQITGGKMRVVSQGAFIKLFVSLVRPIFWYNKKKFDIRNTNDFLTSENDFFISTIRI